MEIKRKELLELALMGIDMKIEKKEKSILIGEKLIEKMKRECDVSILKFEETVNKRDRLKREVKELYKYKSDLIWYDEIEELKII